MCHKLALVQLFFQKSDYICNYLNLLSTLPTGVVSKKLIGAFIIESKSFSCRILAAVIDAIATDIVWANIDIAEINQLSK